MFIRNAWYVAAWGDEIGETPLARRICNEPVVLFRDREGRVAALVDMCCHRGAPLHMGKVVEEGLQCGYHGLIFDRAGTCVRKILPKHQTRFTGFDDKISCACTNWQRTGHARPRDQVEGDLRSSGRSICRTPSRRRIHLLSGEMEGLSARS